MGENGGRRVGARWLVEELDCKLHTRSYSWRVLLCHVFHSGLEREADQWLTVNANDVESIEEVSSLSNRIDLADVVDSHWASSCRMAAETGAALKDFASRMLRRPVA
jgi:hypothetical protein